MNIEELTFVSGVGNFDEKQACIMSAAVAKWRLDHGEPLGNATDRLECVCPVIRGFAIRVNDSEWWRDDDERTAVLRPFIDKILDTADPAKTRSRAFMVADAAVRSFAPMALDVIGHADDATKLRTLTPIIDRETALAGRDMARVARRNADAAAVAGAVAAAAADAAAVADGYAVAATAAATAAVAATAAATAAVAVAAADADAAAVAVAGAGAAADAAAAADSAARYKYHEAKIPARNAALELLERLCGI